MEKPCASKIASVQPCAAGEQRECSPMLSLRGTVHEVHGPCEHRDTNRGLQKKSGIVAGLLFTMKIPTRTCRGEKAPLPA
jgi:hypothetical protein